MLKRKLGFIFLITCLILITIPTALCFAPNAPVVTVSRDGSGDFNCDGIKDELQINQALKYVADHPEYTTVHLKGPATYTIRNTLYIGNNTTLEGENNVVLKLDDHINWPAGKYLVRQMNNTGNSNITIQNFEIEANQARNVGMAKKGTYKSFFSLRNCENVTVSNVSLYEKPTVFIKNINLKAEWVQISNKGYAPVSLKDWKIVEESNNQTYVFPSYTLRAKSTVFLYTTKGINTRSKLCWGSNQPVWDNKGDTAYLYNAEGKPISTLKIKGTPAKAFKTKQQISKAKQQQISKAKQQQISKAKQQQISKVKQQQISKAKQQISKQKQQHKW